MSHPVSSPRDSLRAAFLKQPKILLSGALAAGGLVVWLLYVPAYAVVRRADGECRRLKMEVAHARGILDQVGEGKIWPLPSVEAMPMVLSQLSAAARLHEVQILECTPAPVRSASEGFVIQPVELQVEGEYRSLGEFLGALRGNPSFGAVCIRRIKIAREEQLLPRLKARLSLEAALDQNSDVQ